MIKLDLITGFLGSGKTTFLKKYASYLLSQGEKLCIIENDFGAINVDMVLLKELEKEGCNLEMVVGGDGAEAHKRRLKTKLISMAMQGFTRVIIEPSGIYDVDEFFDLQYEEPLDRWYEIGNVIAVINPKMNENMSEASRYIYMEEAARAGMVLISRYSECTESEINLAIECLQNAMKDFGCQRCIKREAILAKDWRKLDKSDFDKIVKCGFKQNNHVKIPIQESESFQTLFYFDYSMDEEELLAATKKVFDDAECGLVHRIKGIVKSSDGRMFELNTTRNEKMTRAVTSSTAILIIIGEKLNKDKIATYLGIPSL